MVIFMGFDFYKIHGTGNDFIVIDNRSRFFPFHDHLFVKNICTNHTGIGADGLLLIENSDRADFRMRFFNSDGHESDMCVNGSRCICHISFLLKLIDKKHSFEAGDGIHLGEILAKNRVRVEVKYHKNKDLRKFPTNFKLPESISFLDFLNTGVPHVVLRCDEIHSVPVNDLGSKIRFHPYYAPEGTNVNFVEFSEKESVMFVRTFERGVDSETLSCGSGVTASVISYENELNGGKNRFTVNTRGGTLVVENNRNDQSIFLEGPVKVIYKGTYIEEEIS
jgi:diaminopimelate epimerase